ncbi:MAG TPA: LysM peptidoglycan-binding domain-containing protein, partial [Thermodesulfovibrionales bacterium]|nr:LysM peptidoglycan-binding domain-containing protein [Thermodesulfovibrionales bacterium]
IYALPSYADAAYTVKKGDSLAKIAKKFRVPVESIREANALASDELKPGTKLEIPVKQTASRKKPSPPETVSAASGKDRKDATAQDLQYHTVTKGDTLSSLSKKYSTPVKELRELNNLMKSARLKPGQQIAVKRVGPRTYTVKKGDTLLKISKKFSVTPDDIITINNLESDDLKPGQRLVLDEVVQEEQAGKSSQPILSRARIAEDIRTLSDSPELESMEMKDRVILFAKKMLNIPYRFGGSSFMGIDCSAYVQKVYGFLNMPIPRSAREQYHVGESVDKEDLSIGDLVFFRTYASFPSHVGIYLGNNLFIHASSRGKRVTIDSLETPYYFKRFIGAKRLLSEESPVVKEEPKIEG